MQVEGFRLSPQQKHLWLLQQSQQAMPYRSQVKLDIKGNLNRIGLKTAIQTVFDKFEILHTTFRKFPGLSLPVQVISASSKPLLEEHDLSEVPEAERAGQVNVIADQAWQRALDLENGPLVSLSHVVMSAREHRLLITAHALCSDQVSLANIAQELASAYEIAIGKSKSAASEEDEAMQYADIAEWQLEVLDSEDGELGRKYWQDQGLDLEALHHIKLPFERENARSEAFLPARHEFQLPAGVKTKLESRLRTDRDSAQAVLQACFHALLWRVSDGAIRVAGWSFDGRKYEELTHALGLFSKTLPVQTRVSDGVTLNGLVEKTQAITAEAMEWEEFFSWEKLYKPADGHHRAVYLPYGFKFEDAYDAHAAGDITIAVASSRACTDRFTIQLAAKQRGDSFDLAIDYDANKIEAGDAERLATQFAALLGNALDRPDVALSSLEYIGTDERRKVVVDFNQTEAEISSGTCLHHLIEKHAATKPDAAAVVFGEQSLSYAELNTRANQLAHRLIRQGVEPERPVAICVERSLEMAIGILAILKAGGVYVPLDPTYPQERLRYMLDDTQAPVLLTQQKLAVEMFEPLQLDAGIICLDSDWKDLATEGTHDPGVAVFPENAAYVIYTSGSTGKPKGVLIPHQNIVNSTLARAAYYREPFASFLLLSSFAFDSSIVGIFWPLCQGATLVLPEQDAEKDPTQVLAMIAEHGITHILGLPSLYNLLLDQQDRGQLSSLRAIMVAGESCPAVLTQKHHRHLKAASLYNEYGTTEGTVWSSVYHIDHPLQDNQVAIGKPIANAQIFLLDPHQNVIPIGISGELCVGGRGVARGYLNRASLTGREIHPEFVRE